MSTGSPSQDAQHDFSRARRARLLADVARRLRGEPDDVAMILPFEEVVDALGRLGQVDRGLTVVQLDDIVGTVDRAADFDRGFRPTTQRLRSRWERIAAAQRRGEAMPPVSLYKVGDLYFVRDGHHRVSVAKSQGRDDIDAYVTEVTTKLKLSHDLRVSELPLKDHERLFRERVPLTAAQRERISLSDPWEFGWLAEMVEAWGFRMMQERGHFADRYEVAKRWFEQEYAPVSDMLGRGRADRARGDRGRGVHAPGRPALPDAAHARVVRRDRQPPATRQRQEAPAAPAPAAPPALLTRPLG